MTPEGKKHLVRRLDQILEVAKKTQQEHKELLEKRKKRREERLERLLDPK